MVQNKCTAAGPLLSHSSTGQSWVACRKRKQEDHCELYASLGYRVKYETFKKTNKQKNKRRERPRETHIENRHTLSAFSNFFEAVGISFSLQLEFIYNYYFWVIFVML